MKKALKIIVAVISVLIILILLTILSFFVLTANAELDEEKLVNLERVVEYYDKNDELILRSSSGINTVIIDELSPYVYNAFVAVEDERFYQHDGVDVKSLIRAFFSNLKSFSFKEGGSTISQQLIKNTQTGGDKTISRKLTEMRLALKLEKKYGKTEILEKYLNSIYFGNGCYGIKDAANLYFDKEPTDLTISESAILASIIKSPSNYAPNKNPENCKNRRDLVLKKMLEQKYISKAEYDSATASKISTLVNENGVEKSFIKQLKSETEYLIKDYPYDYKTLKVYTNFNQKVQESIDKYFTLDGVKTDKTVLILDKENLVCAYRSTIGERERQLGSIIKPILVYAPAIELDEVYPCTIIKDEKTEIDGYSVKNYNDAYYGDVSVRFSLSKSLNSCAVKLLNGTGIKRCIEYAKKCGINIESDENNLSLALGSTQKGTTLLNAVGAYSALRDGGEYVKPSFIKKITDESGKVVFSNAERKIRVFSKGTTELMTEMLNYTVKNGTAKALSSRIPLCAKTGTVGNENGNTDAYTISYNPEYVVGVWYGNADSSYMNNEITGGSYPARLSNKIWSDVYKNTFSPKFPENTESVQLDIDREEYSKGRVVLADDNAPERYRINEIFKKTNVPKEISSNFSSPKVLNCKITVNYNSILLRLCLTKQTGALVYKEYNGKKELVFNVKESFEEVFLTDNKIRPNTEYVYSIVPYFNSKGNVIYGDTFYFDKIKSPEIPSGDWWL